MSGRGARILAILLAGFMLFGAIGAVPVKAMYIAVEHVDTDGDPELEEPPAEPDVEADPEPDIETDPELDGEADPQESSALLETAADTASAADVVYSTGELEAWVLENQTGGRVVLGCSLVIEESVNIHAQGHIIIDTGAYGLVLDGGWLDGDSYELVGQGVEVPVLTVLRVYTEDTPFYLSYNWMQRLSGRRITAEGRDGVGGTALWAQLDDREIEAALESFDGTIDVRSYGAGAVGLHLAVPTTVYCFDVAVAGTDSVAVVAPQGGRLYYCKLSASGTGAASVRGDGLVVNTCTASPAPENAEVLQRRFVAGSANTLEYFLRQNSRDRPPSADYIPLLVDEGGDYYIVDFFSVTWERQTVNTVHAGETVLPGHLPPILQGLGLEDSFQPDLKVIVRDPALPCIESLSISYKRDSDVRTVMLHCWDKMTLNSGEALLRTDDGGIVWQDISDSAQVLVGGNGSISYNHQQDEAFLLKLVVAGVGESNIVAINSYDRLSHAFKGGDRDGGDRGIRVPKTGGTAGENSGDENPNGGNLGNGNSGNGNSGSTKPGGSSGSRDTTTTRPSTPDTAALVDEKPEELPPDVLETPADDPIDAQNDAVLKAESAIPAMAEAFAAPPLEWEDEITVTISGKRLFALLEADPRGVTFLKQELQIFISAQSLAALALREDDLFELRVEQLPEHVISLLIQVNGNDVTDLLLTVYIKAALLGDWDPAAVSATTADEPLPIDYDGADGKLAVRLPGSCVFRLTGQARVQQQVVRHKANPSPIEPSPSAVMSPMLWSVILAVPAAGVGVVYFRRRKYRKV